MITFINPLTGTEMLVVDERAEEYLKAGYPLAFRRSNEEPGAEPEPIETVEPDAVPEPKTEPETKTAEPKKRTAAKKPVKKATTARKKK